MTVFYCIEDELSRAVAVKLISAYCPIGTHSQELGEAYGGFGYIRKNLKKFVDLAKIHPVLVITDLDKASCEPGLRSNWLTSANIQEPLPARMAFCIAKTEIESWLMADKEGICSFLKISPAKIKVNIESSIVDAKEFLVQLARSSGDRELRSDLTPAKNSVAMTGLGYNFRLSQFVAVHWDPSKAAENSNSLRRAITRLSAVHLP